MSETQLLAHRYREVAIRTANPLQLVVMLYDAAICSTKEAREHMERKDIAGRSKSINRCISIISELQSCLNLQAGGDIASSLNRLYDYMKRSLFKANVEQSVQPLTEVEVLLENIRSAWNELAAQNNGLSDPAAAKQAQGGRMPVTPPAATLQPKSVNISI